MVARIEMPRQLPLRLLGFLRVGDDGVEGGSSVLWQLQIKRVDLLVAYIPRHQRRIVQG
jgi:hypothetical protein